MKKMLLIFGFLLGFTAGNIEPVVPQQPLFSFENIHQQVAVDFDKIDLAEKIIPYDTWRCLYKGLYKALLLLDKRNMLNEENILLSVNEECLKAKDIKITSLKNIPIIEILKLFRNYKISDIDSKLTERKRLYTDYLPLLFFFTPLSALGGIRLTRATLERENPYGFDPENPFHRFFVPSLVSVVIGTVPVAALYDLSDNHRSIRKLEADMNKIDDLIEKIEKIQKEANE